MFSNTLDAQCASSCCRMSRTHMVATCNIDVALCEHFPTLAIPAMESRILFLAAVLVVIRHRCVVFDDTDTASLHTKSEQAVNRMLLSLARCDIDLERSISSWHRFIWLDSIIRFTAAFVNRILRLVTFYGNSWTDSSGSISTETIVVTFFIQPQSSYSAADCC